MTTTIDKVQLTPRKALVLTGKHAVLIAASVIALFPLVLIISTALKTSDDVMLNPFGLFSSFSSENLDTAWNVGGFSQYIVNSLLLAVPSTLMVVILSTAGGYAFALTDDEQPEPRRHVHHALDGEFDALDRLEPTH